MNENEIKRFAALHLWIGILLFSVCFWDIYALKVSDWFYYYPFKISVLCYYFGMSYFISVKKVSPATCMDFSMPVFYIYSYIGMMYLHPTYLFSFYEGLAVLCFIYNGSSFRYAAHTFFALVLNLICFQNMPEPDFIKAGHSIVPHLKIVTIIMAVLSYVIFHFFNRQKQVIIKMDQKFASIGRQSAFLLHELKSPLSRFMVKNADKDNRDAEYIYSIVEGVELLITKKENLSFIKLNWEDIKSYLEDEFSETCKHYQITMEISGFEGEGSGHRSTIKLALKNLIKNAVESIVQENKPGIIKITRIDNLIEVSNDGSIISSEKIDQLFQPFYSEKKTKSNYGIGLHFVDSVVKAHNGTIEVKVENGWNIFKLKLGQIS